MSAKQHVYISTDGSFRIGTRAKKGEQRLPDLLGIQLDDDQSNQILVETSDIRSTADYTFNPADDFALLAEYTDQLVAYYYGNEYSQYDPKCSFCILGHSHTWDQHDLSIDVYEDRKRQYYAELHIDDLRKARITTGVMSANADTFWGIHTTYARKLAAIHDRRVHAYSVAVRKYLAAFPY